MSRPATIRTDCTNGLVTAAAIKADPHVRLLSRTPCAACGQPIGATGYAALLETEVSAEWDGQEYVPLLVAWKFWHYHLACVPVLETRECEGR